MTGDEIETRIMHVIRETLRDKGEAAEGITRQSPVDERLGLDSLDWAVVIVRLEDELQVDPFRQHGSELQSVGDLVDLYRKTMSRQ